MSSTTAPITIPRTSHATLAAVSVLAGRPDARRPPRTTGRPGTVASCSRRHGLPVTVSATSLDVDGEVRAMVRPHVPNYVARRVVVGVAAVVALTFGLLATVGLMAGVSGTTASAASTGGSSAGIVAPSIHVARSGDTMWSIANTYRGDVDRDRYIAALIDANGGADVHVGAAVLLP